MQRIQSYIFTWRPDETAGNLHLSLANETGADLPLDNASEASFLLELLRTEDATYFDEEHRLIVSGLALQGAQVAKY